jgi:hypothetical protein
MKTMYQRNFKSTKNTRRSKNGVLGTFGEGSFKSEWGIRVTDSWGVESTQEPRNSIVDPSNRPMVGLLERRVKESEGVSFFLG